MNKEYMQALYDLFGLVAFQKSLTKEQYARVQKYNDIIEQALQRLESIDNANPSEALVYINSLIKENDYDIKNQNNTGFDIDTQKKWVKYLNNKLSLLNSIKQALLKAQENEKVLEIIINKNVDFDTLTDSEALDDYNSKMNWSYRRLTQEEFDLLKRYLYE